MYRYKFNIRLTALIVSVVFVPHICFGNSPLLENEAIAKPLFDVVLRVLKKRLFQHSQNHNVAYADEVAPTSNPERIDHPTPLEDGSNNIIDLEKLIENYPHLEGVDSIEKFLEFINTYKSELSNISQRAVDDVLGKMDPKDKAAMHLNYMAVPGDSDIFKILTPFGRLPVITYRINYKNKWQVLMFIESGVSDSEYLKFALHQNLQYAIYLTRHELIKQRFPETRVFPLSTGAFLALGQFYYTIAIAAAQYVPSFDSLMVDVVGWLTSGFPTGSRIKLLREVLPHEESHMRFFRLPKEEQARVMTSILNELGKERIERIYNVIGFWHEQDNPNYFTAPQEMVEHPEWFDMDNADMPGVKRAWVLKLSSGKYLNLAIFMTEFLSTLSMDLASLGRIYGVPREFINRLKALYDERQGIGFNMEREFSGQTIKLLKDLGLISPDISEHLSIISMQYPYLILEECWKGYFSDYDLDEIIGLTYAKKILSYNGFDRDKLNMVKPTVIKYWLTLTYRGEPLTVLEKIPTLSQWVILILASLYQKYPKDKAIEEIINSLDKISTVNILLKNSVPLSVLISKKGTDTRELNGIRARLIQEIMGDLNNIGFIRRLTKDAKDLNTSEVLSMTLFSKYICTVKTGGLISLRLALEEHIDRALADKGSLMVDLDLNTLLAFDKKGNVYLKDVYFTEAVNLLRSITKDKLEIRLINFSDNSNKNKAEKALDIEQFKGKVNIVNAADRDFALQKEAVKIAYDKDSEQFGGSGGINIRGKKVYFEGEEFEVISSFDVLLSSLIILCGGDKNFLKFQKEFLDTLPKGYKTYDNDNNLVELVLPAIPDELITKEYLRKLKNANKTIQVKQILIDNQI
jgi:hypothetical protein